MLELKNICFKAENEDGIKEILQDVNLTLDDKKFIVLTGPNGGGKSTLAKVIAGILTPDSGKIFYNGTDITHKTVTERARMGIGFAFQQPVRFKGITVRELLSLAAGAELNEHGMCEYLSDVGLCARDYIDREVNASLSGGEIKRIEIAMTMARRTGFTVFDEPEAGIDLWSFSNLIEVFKRMRRSTNGTILVISHQERIMEISDEIVVISAGRVVSQGATGDILPELLSEGPGACGGRCCASGKAVK